MFIEFKTLKFKNLLSYGNQITEVNFENGLNLLTGKNGNGKSSILDAFCFALYGQPYRKIKIKELINIRNQKRLYTEIEFRVNKNNYKIIRTLNPPKLQILKNDNEMELLSSKRLTQTEIDKIIGINYNLFRQIISLAINYNKPFLSLPTPQKRDIVESIFNIKIFGEMLRVLKKNNTGIRLQNDIHKKTIGILENNIRQLHKQIKDTKITIRDFEKNKNLEIRNINKRIKKYETEVKSIDTILLKLNNQITKIDVTEKDIKNWNIKKDELLEKINKNQYTTKRAKMDISVLTENDTCPLCKKDISSEYKNIQIDVLTEKINIFSKKLNELQAECDAVVFKMEHGAQNLKKKNKYKNDVLTHENKKEYILTEITNAKDSKQLVKDRTLNFNLEEIQKLYDLKKKEYINIRKEYKQLNHTIKNNDIVSDILSENGIKAYFLKKLIPLLNKKINNYLSNFELPLQLTFDEYLQEQIINLGNGNKVVNYYSLSEGEKKRVDMSILFSFIDITKNISNWNCNLIIMDELLDSSIDDSGLDKMIESIKLMIYNSKQNLSIYIISHRMLENNMFKNIYQVEKIGGFSKISTVTP